MNHPHHPVVVSAPRGLARSLQPWLLQRSDDDFIPATLDDLRGAGATNGTSGTNGANGANGLARLRDLRARATNKNGTLKLFQPIQRQFHLALVEAWCDMPGEPRVDPAKIESAGLVLRRLGAGGQPEGWMKSNGRIRGWVPMSRVGGADADPAPAQRAQRDLTGVADIDRQLVAFSRERPDTLLEEQAIPLYLAPPDVCAEAGQTLYYGLVPTVSGEISETDASFGAAEGFDFGPSSSAFRGHLVQALRGESMTLPKVGESVSRGWLEESEQPGANSNLVRFVLMLRQLAGEFDAFGPAGAAILQALHPLQLPLVRRNGEWPQRTVRADEFLTKAHTLILAQGNVSGTVEMPETWPAMSASQTQQLLGAMHAAMRARFTAMKAKTGRFDEPDARYQLRAFVRLKADGPCPARVVWSAPSEPFVIAAWYEGAGAPPVQIALPDPADKQLLAALKPNVAFVVPPSLQSLLMGSAKDLIDGKKPPPMNPALTWICGFNIPIITICAFLVLNIFLSLFNLFFGWLFAMKICLPFPKIPPQE
ncbi:hypothetical protein ACFJIX_16835 [Roseateles sp. UC29_93]|uniref:hypothetical protein n=1 Tax=Roseateles sp. UC29_93 TaxID=3350177 RepID=UPI00366A6AD1